MGAEVTPKQGGKEPGKSIKQKKKKRKEEEKGGGKEGLKAGRNRGGEKGLHWPPAGGKRSKGGKSEVQMCKEKTVGKENPGQSWTGETPLEEKPHKAVFSTTNWKKKKRVRWGCRGLGGKTVILTKTSRRGVTRERFLQLRGKGKKVSKC